MSPREQRLAQRLFLAYAVVASSIGAAMSSISFPFLSHPSFARLLFWHAPVWILWGVFAAILDPLVRRLRIGRFPLTRAILGYAILAVPTIALHVWFTVWWIWWAHPDRLAGVHALPLDRSRYGRQLPIDLLTYCAIAAVLLAIRAWKRAGESERLLAEARLRTLEAQLQPHFLFNALQAIATLIRKEPDGAVEMVNTLSSLLRRSLATPASAAIPLSAELAAVADYLLIQQVRFRDRLQIVQRIDDAALSCLVPPFLLQPLVENAFVHGLEAVSGGVSLTLEVRLQESTLVVTIDNDGPPIHRTEEGIGLRSVRERLRHRHGAAASMQLSARNRGTVVRVTLPAIHSDEGAA